MKRFFLIGILSIVLVFATSYRTDETFASPSTDILDASASAYINCYITQEEGAVYIRWDGSVSASMYARSMDTPNSGGCVYSLKCWSLDYSRNFEFYNGFSYSDSFSMSLPEAFHCFARVTIWSNQGGYDYDMDKDGKCRVCKYGKYG